MFICLLLFVKKSLNPFIYRASRIELSIKRDILSSKQDLLSIKQEPSILRTGYTIHKTGGTIHKTGGTLFLYTSNIKLSAKREIYRLKDF
ncbi:hypothetical protein AsAng_0064380 (plasmid) [Aureispira anguillae]|uniref:Uncharacterized protein n=1 Tax=Aureispira anguillae TaxID=2864201 RepID=A0A916DVZ6_9BACT|nr:hypothetical protein AsAng_0064380 [Aureispira anguillae]